MTDAELMHVWAKSIVGKTPAEVEAIEHELHKVRSKQADIPIRPFTVYND